MMRKSILVSVFMVMVVMHSINVFGAEPIEAQIKQMKDGIAEGGAQKIIDHYNKCWSTDFINLTHTTILNFMNEGSIVIAAFQAQELELMSADCYYCAVTIGKAVATRESEKYRNIKMELIQRCPDENRVEFAQILNTLKGMYMKSKTRAGGFSSACRKKVLAASR